jgi:hypothetical protein
MTNPTNKSLTNNLLPLWTGHELTEPETFELLEEVEGKTDKGKLFQYSKKNKIVLKTNIYKNFRFPFLGKDYREHRLNETKQTD